MKVEWQRKVGYMDINPVFRMKLGAFSQLLQEAAVTHSERVGIHSRELVANGTVWVLNKMAFEFRRLPTFGEDIRVLTWHKGSRGFKAYRDFEVFAGEELLVSVTSLWLFIDLKKKRPRRIPPEWQEVYTVESGEALDFDLNSWQPGHPGTNAATIPITLRSSDFDPQGHVNHTAYFDFIETLMDRTLGGGNAPQGLRIQFRREIPRQVTAITAGMARSQTGAHFGFYNGDKTFVCGEIDFPRRRK